jgi:hypothetical protein
VKVPDLIERYREGDRLSSRRDRFSTSLEAHMSPLNDPGVDTLKTVEI